MALVLSIDVIQREDRLVLTSLVVAQLELNLVTRPVDLGHKELVEDLFELINFIGTNVLVFVLLLLLLP